MEMQDIHLSGYFRDGVRRVDLVVVSEDHTEPQVETLKMQFLINAVDAGFQFEIEPGVKNKNRHLLFIKIHAPDSLIKRYGGMFDMRKYFKRNHAEFIRSWVPQESELVKLVRLSYPGPFEYSTQERSHIVYKILQRVAFDSPQNYVGLQKFVDIGVFRDVYPLHDGPNFLVPKQLDEKLNGRQAIYYKAFGYSNLLLPVPIHLIREYLGDKIGFLFTLYQYTILYFFVIGIPGILVYFLDTNPGTEFYNIHKDFENNFVCPKCSDFIACPFRSIQGYADENNYKKSLDNTLYHRYSLVIVVAGIILSLVWRRKEFYLNWLWEVKDEYERTGLRAQYFDEPPKKITFKQRIMRVITSWYTKEFGLSLLILCLFFLIYLPIILTLQLTMMNRMGHAEGLKGSYNYKSYHFVLAGTACLNGVVVFFLEKFWGNFVKWFIYETHYTEEDSYERAYVVKLFGFSAVINFTYIFFFTYLKGALYTYPVDPERWTMAVQLGTQNCGLYTCIDEAYLAAVYTYFGKTVVQELFCFIQNLPRDIPGQQPTAEELADKKRVPFDDENVPSWEREFGLRPFTTHEVYLKFNYIFLQIAYATFFAWVFPLAPLLIGFLNIWKIRYWVRMEVLHRRRPLVAETWGLGYWRHVLWVLPYLAALCNAIAIARNSSVISIQVIKKMYENPDLSKGIIHLSVSCTITPKDTSVNGLAATYKEYMSVFESNKSSSQSTTGRAIEVKDCYGSGQYFNEKFENPGMLYEKANPVYTRKDGLSSNGSAIADKWYISWHSTLFVLLSQLLVILIGLLLHNLMTAECEEVEEMMDAEEHAKEFRVRRETTKKTQGVQDTGDSKESGDKNILDEKKSK